MKINHRYSNKGGTVVLEDLKEAVPSIFAESPAENVSSRYGFVNTKQIVDIMRKDGFEVAHASGGLRQRSRTHGIHEVRLRQIGTAIKLNEVFPEIVLINSHDGSSSAILHMGLFRQVCSNGLIVGAAFQQSVRVPHIGDPEENVLTAARFIMDSTPKLIDTIDTWRNRQMTIAEIDEFGRRALDLRKAAGNVVGSVTEPRRYEDNANNLWNVFNRTQESLVRGGVLTQSEKTGKFRRTRGLRAVKPLVALNRGLWDLAEEFLPN